MQIDDNIKFGMIEAISHLIHRDYEAIVKDFVTLDFIPEGTDLRPILPVLSKVGGWEQTGGIEWECVWFFVGCRLADVSQRAEWSNHHDSAQLLMNHKSLCDSLLKVALLGICHKVHATVKGLCT